MVLRIFAGFGSLPESLRPEMDFTKDPLGKEARVRESSVFQTAR